MADWDLRFRIWDSNPYFQVLGFEIGFEVFKIGD